MSRYFFIFHGVLHKFQYALELRFVRYCCHTECYEMDSPSVFCWSLLICRDVLIESVEIVMCCIYMYWLLVCSKNCGRWRRSRLRSSRRVERLETQSVTVPLKVCCCLTPAVPSEGSVFTYVSLSVNDTVTSQNFQNISSLAHRSYLLILVWIDRDNWA